MTAYVLSIYADVGIYSTVKLQEKKISDTLLLIFFVIVIQFSFFFLEITTEMKIVRFEEHIKLLKYVLSSLWFVWNNNQIELEQGDVQHKYNNAIWNGWEGVFRLFIALSLGKSVRLTFVRLQLEHFLSLLQITFEWIMDW